MNKYLVCGLFLTFMTAPSMAAKVSYKCYLLTTKGQEIAFYRWNEDDFAAKQATIVASKRTDAKGKTYYVKAVEECVKMSDEFSSEVAKKLDKQTLR
ncbi:TapY2 family type IVa secretion system protein [Shewanella yunxiaonensis]|uniref:TapY2 family type IVa secretion system protein n=1 Tax=Shewanella yunxiaonensis TaxID=2829809 RepID=A0ABX7YRD5_9GAMM|nr:MULTISPECIES: TapY2 family type IVa secretion system protein [Shewanella]MDF0534464.1 TapY2 family type IVa secretion system protein [Shewanella sp. A32]QUN04909.1 TapY2 family type IVa secretion system protein [Shewanella yunxiaonensis]